MVTTFNCSRCNDNFKTIRVLSYHTSTEQWQIQCQGCWQLMRDSNKQKLIDRWNKDNE